MVATVATTTAIDECVHETAVHDEYVHEVDQLVEQQAEALFELLATAVEQVSAGTPRLTITRDGRSLTVAAGTQAATCVVEAITHHPENVDRVRAFARSQARCIATMPDGAVAEWILARPRLGAGGTVFSGMTYTWLDSLTDKPLTVDDIVTLLRPVMP